MVQRTNRWTDGPTKEWTDNPSHRDGWTLFHQINARVSQSEHTIPSIDDTTKGSSFKDVITFGWWWWRPPVWYGQEQRQPPVKTPVNTPVKTHVRTPTQTQICTQTHSHRHAHKKRKAKQGTLLISLCYRSYWRREEKKENSLLRASFPFNCILPRFLSMSICLSSRLLFSLSFAGNAMLTTRRGV